MFNKYTDNDLERAKNITAIIRDVVITLFSLVGTAFMLLAIFD